MRRAALKREWRDAPANFTKLVDWLDAGIPSNGESYVEMHSRLTAFFTRKGCRAPLELADETLTRVNRRIVEEGGIVDVAPAQFCYITARFVFLESLRGPERRDESIDRDLGEPARDAADDERERVSNCLERCLEQLPAEDRRLILDYYAGSGSDRIAARRELAAKLGVTANTVAIRACRIRERLRACVSQCADRT